MSKFTAISYHSVLLFTLFIGSLSVYDKLSPLPSGFLTPVNFNLSVIPFSLFERSGVCICTMTLPFLSFMRIELYPACLGFGMSKLTLKDNVISFESFSFISSSEILFCAAPAFARLTFTYPDVHHEFPADNLNEFSLPQNPPICAKGAVSPHVPNVQPFELLVIVSVVVPVVSKSS